MARDYATLADKADIEQTPVEERWSHRNVYELLTTTAERFPDRPGVTFQLKSGPKDPATTLTWREFHKQVTQAANLFHSLGVGRDDVVAYLMPSMNEAAVALVAGMTAGVVNPINPLLEPAQIGELLRETNAKVLVTLAAFPKVDMAQRVAEALTHAPNVEYVLEVDLKPYLAPPLSWLIPFIRPKFEVKHKAKVLNFNAEMARKRSDALVFENVAGPDTVCAYFHTGGTTGMPKVAQHTHHGAMYNGWVSSYLLTTEKDVMLCPLPLFHVFAAYPVLMSCMTAGAHMVIPTPAGFRGDGVMDNFWKLVERWGVTFMIMVPTAASALMQRPVNADISSLHYAFCGSAPLPQELFRKFEKATNVKILEGYGMTEATCLVSCNPPDGEKKIGSVGLPFPYTDVRILDCAPDGSVSKECGPNEIGEICLKNPGVISGYTDESRNVGLFADGVYLRTGDLGRIDENGYLWITGRAKDLIIRGGHNIDPAMIEECLMAHPDVAFVGAIGQPDAHSGELPCAYVELVEGATASSDDLADFAKENIPERAAAPKYVEVMDELPKTAVGKVFKPDLRKRAIKRVFNAALDSAGLEARVIDVEDNKTTGLTAIIEGGTDEAVTEAVGAFPPPWRRP